MKTSTKRRQKGGQARPRFLLKPKAGSLNELPPPNHPLLAESGWNMPGHDRILEQLEAIFRSSYDGIWICDGEGRILRLNPASERINN